MTTTRESLAAYAEARDLTLLFFDPPEYFDAAILGLVVGFGQEPSVLYDMEKVLAAMAKDMGEEGAEEWFDFNTIGAFLGPETPRFLIRVMES
jgi:hypothetical protein